MMPSAATTPRMAATPASEAAIDVRALRLRYGAKLALNDLSLTLARGGIHALVGANGAGKSTLFRVLLGFESADAGSATILGCDSARLTPALRGRIGFVNEEHTLPGWMTVAALAAMQRRAYPQWREARYAGVLSHFNVAPGQRVGILSRGERAGVNLAMALAQSPELLILDEPTLGLDVVAKRAFLDALMPAADDATIVYCSHQMDEIERVADQLVILERGGVRHQGAPDDFCDQIRLWVADFPFAMPEAHTLPGVLQVTRIDGLTHVMVFDGGDDIEARLRLLGARSVNSMPVGLERAVKGFLARGHAGAPGATAAPSPTTA